MDTNEFITKSSIVHGGLYNYEKTVYVKSLEKVIITCNIHGDFEQTPNNHLNNRAGCPICLGKFKYTKEQFISKCSEVHNNKYDYSLVEYVNNKTKVKIICPVHGEFNQKAGHHLSGKECIKCAALLRASVRKHDSDIFKEKAKQIHGERYTYDKVKYQLSSKNVIITCPIHGDFLQKPSLHLFGQGCKTCNQSKGELSIQKFLDELGIEYIQQHKFSDCKNKRHLLFDFYIPSKNLCIEYDGVQHYKSIEFFGGDKGLEETRVRDKIKNNYCFSNGIDLIRIRYDQDLLEELNRIF